MAGSASACGSAFQHLYYLRIPSGTSPLYQRGLVHQVVRLQAIITAQSAINEAFASAERPACVRLRRMRLRPADLATGRPKSRHRSAAMNAGPTTCSSSRASAAAFLSAMAGHHRILATSVAASDSARLNDSPSVWRRAATGVIPPAWGLRHFSDLGTRINITRYAGLLVNPGAAANRHLVALRDRVIVGFRTTQTHMNARLTAKPCSCQRSRRACKLPRMGRARRRAVPLAWRSTDDSTARLSRMRWAVRGAESPPGHRTSDATAPAQPALAPALHPLQHASECLVGTQVRC